MSRKSSNPKLMEDPPAASSSEEETSSGEGEEGNSSSEEDVASIKTPIPALPSTEKKKQVSDSESEEESEEEESESDSEPVSKDPVQKAQPPVTKIDDSVVVKKQASEKVKTLEKSESKKRSSETDGGADAKKVKRVSGEEEKKSYFQRVWTDDDEISLLKGFVDFATEKKKSPYDDFNAFYLYVKKSISFDVSKIQFSEKLRGLKKKFEKKLGKGKNGEEPIFAKAHDGKTYEFSVLIWGDNGIAPVSAEKPKGKSKEVVTKQKQKRVSSLLEEEGTTKEEETLFVKFLARFGVDDLAAQQGWSRLASEDKKRFEEQLEALHLQQLEFHSKTAALVHEVVTKMANP